MVWQMIRELPKIFKSIYTEHHLSAGDFPEIKHFQAKLEELDFMSFHSLAHHQELLSQLEEAINQDLSEIVGDIQGTWRSVSSAPVSRPLDNTNQQG